VRCASADAGAAASDYDGATVENAFPEDRCIHAAPITAGAWACSILHLATRRISEMRPLFLPLRDADALQGMAIVVISR
jgi:hypothetical protein